jgi:phenylalanine-4-hydroxylase
LNEFKKTMGWITGGLPGVRKAITSGSTATLVFANGLQVSGTFTEVIDEDGEPVLVRTLGPTALSMNNVQLESFGKERFPNGISITVGKDIEVDGVRITTGDKIISAFAGPADPEAFEPNVNVPREKMHKIVYDKKALALHDLYRQVRNARSNRALVSKLPSIWESVRKSYPSDWLLPLEILEVFQLNSVEEGLQLEIRRYLEEKAKVEVGLSKVIRNGLMLLEGEVIGTVDF